MPLYEYQCIECGTEFEKMVRFSETSQEQPCPTCHAKNTKKKISSFASLGSANASFGTSIGSNCGSSGGFT